MIFIQIFKILFWPFRRVARLFRTGAKEAGGVTHTAAKTGAGAIARAASDDILGAEYREDPPTGLEAALFKQLPRPRLTERSASDLTLEQAASFAADAKEFYGFKFPLFARGDFFYEEVEEEYLNAALGFKENSIDRRFLDVTTVFRRTLNANTRRMLLYWTPVLFLVTFGSAFWAIESGFSTPSAEKYMPAGGADAALFIAAAAASLIFAFLIYSWPYKVVQQRNLMNLDNYITSKFARINNNFQVAKRRALNVERDKRMGQREELKEEAGSWTLAYHWFAIRLMLCELVIRNKFYQVRRNTTLYWAGGLVLTFGVFAVLLAALWINGVATSVIGVYIGAAAVNMIAVGLIMGRAAGMMFQVLEANEWSRFHLISLDATIRDHVGEDKLQIVTFRDRNRFE
jgi:hypothetical protein